MHHFPNRFLFRVANSSIDYDPDYGPCGPLMGQGINVWVENENKELMAAMRVEWDETCSDKRPRMALTLYGNHFEGVPGLYTLLLEPLSKQADGYMEPPELREFLLAQGFKEVKT